MGEHKELLDAALGRDAEALNRLIAEHFGHTTEIIRRANFNGTAAAVRAVGGPALTDQLG